MCIYVVQNWHCYCTNPTRDVTKPLICNERYSNTVDQEFAQEFKLPVQKRSNIALFYEIIKYRPLSVKQKNHNFQNWMKNLWIPWLDKALWSRCIYFLTLHWQEQSLNDYLGRGTCDKGSFDLKSLPKYHCNAHIDIQRWYARPNVHTGNGN